MFAKRLKALEKKVNMDILKGLPHGFLNLAIVSILFLLFNVHFWVTNVLIHLFINRPVKKLMKGQYCVLNALPNYSKTLKRAFVNDLFVDLIVNFFLNNLCVPKN